MANTATLRIEKRLDDLEARVKSLESGFVRVPQKPITQEDTAREILASLPGINADESKPDLPDKEIKDVEKTRGSQKDRPEHRRPKGVDSEQKGSHD